MKFPKIIEKSILSSENVKEKLSEVKTEAKKELQQELKTQYNKEVSKTVKKALKSARKEWALDTAKALDRKFSKSRKYISTSGYGEKFLANTYQSGKNYNTLDTLFSDSPGSIQCASRIRDAVLGGGYVIKPSVDGKGTKKDLKHLIQFFDRPNPDDTIETLIGVCVENYLAYGNFYLEKVPTKKSANYKKKQMEVAELYNLDPTKMTILVDADKKKKGVLVKTGFKRKTDQNKAVIYNLDEILHTRRPHRKANLYGRAVLEDNTATLQLLLRAITYNINILRNGGRPPIQLILPEDSTEADADAVSAWFEKNYMGPHNAGKTLITFKGARAEALGLTLQDMSYLELLRYGLRLVSGQYGVPLPMIGFPEGTNRACYSADTEVLTEDGWKHHWEVEEEGKIAIFNPDNQSVFFEKPKSLVKYEVAEHLIHFQNKKGGDIFVTEDHTMFYKGATKGKYKIAKAKNIEELTKVIMPSAPKMFKSHYEPKENFTVKAVYHQNHKANEKNTNIPLNDWLAFIGLYLSEGGLFVKGEQSYNYVITFAQSDVVNREKANLIDKLISSLPFSFVRNAKTKDGCRRWSIHDKNLWTYLKNNCGGYCHQKRVPRNLMNLPTDKLKILFDWLMLGDGTISKGRGQTAMAYATISKQLADDVQEIAFKLGLNTKIISNIDKRGNRKELFRVCMSKKTEKHYSSNNGTISREIYTGDVYCFSVSTGFYVTRRNNCIALQGNTMSEMRRSFYLTNVFPLRKLISQKLTKEIVQDGMGIEGWRLDFKTAGLEESEASRRDFMAAWGKGLYTFNECRISMGLLPIDEPWANKHYLLGTKNDSLIEVENAIGRVSETSSPDAPRGKPERKPGDQNPEEDETSHDEN